MLQHIRDVTDPEHPYTLEQLNVVSEELITVSDNAGHVRLVFFQVLLVCFLSLLSDTVSRCWVSGEWQGQFHTDRCALQHGNTDRLVLTSQTHALAAPTLQGNFCWCPILSSITCPLLF